MKRDAGCVAVDVPANGYLASSGRGWECDRGFKKTDDACMALEPPANAHITHSGNGWPGYRQEGDVCNKNARRR